MIFIMAWRNIWRNKMRSVVIILSVAIGLFAGVAVLALYKGMLHSRVRTVIDAEVAHLQIHDTSFKKDYEPVFVLQQADSILKVLHSMPEVKATSARSITQGMLATTTGSMGVQINGVLPQQEYEVSQLKKKIMEGDGFHSGKKNEILIGKKLADKMKLKIGSKLVLTFTDSSAEMISAAFRVASIYRSDNAPLDERNVYVERENLNELLGIGNGLHEIAVLLNHDEDLDRAQRKLQEEFPSYQVETWRQISPETDLMINTVDVYSYIIMVIIMLALAFGIINTMLMAILERTREIGMMTALGMNRVRLFFLVLLETILLTVSGTPIGLGIAWLATNYFNKNGLDLSGMGKEMMSSFGYSTLIYPEFPSDKIIGVMMIVTGTAIVSCLFPAMKALRLQPVEALRR